jgi:DNA-binding NtrC family response regulator
LASYPWPGNVRELAAVIDRAAILGNGERLEIAQALGLGRATAAPGGGRGAGRGATQPAQLVTLDDAMAAHIERALTAAAGRIEGPHGAARLLRINPHTLRARMRKLGIDWTAFRSSCTEEPAEPDGGGGTAAGRWFRRHRCDIR